MMRINKKLTLVASLTALIVVLGTGIAFAQGDTDDNISPASTNFTATNSTNIVFKGTIDGFAITVTCTRSSFSGTTPAFGLGPINITNPTFSGCTDSLSGVDTIMTNSTNGHWQLTFVDSTAAGEETQTEPNSGDLKRITIPVKGATFTSTALPSCVITAAPAAPANVTGAYDDTNTLSFFNWSFPVSGAGCTASSSAITGSYKFTINGMILHDTS